MRLRRHLRATLFVGLAIAFAAPGALAEDGGGKDSELDGLLDKKNETGGDLGGWSDKNTERPRSYPFFEHHGYFRFRTDLFFNGHLGTVVPGVRGSGSSSMLAPLSENFINNDGSNTWFPNGASDDADIIGSANIRFRYKPTIHIDSTLRIHATFDFLDNVVMGSTPDFAGNLRRSDVPLVAFTGSQASPSAGINGFKDAVHVKEAYADWQPAFLLRVGRQASNWGLGILANNGGDRDDDYGDYTDRAFLLFKLFGVYVGAAWDYVYSGATTEDPGDFFGQPKDLGEDDDVQQWVLTFFQRPLSKEEKDTRLKSLREDFKPAFDWGVYTVLRVQDRDLDFGDYDAYRKTGGAANYDDLSLLTREAWAVIPDIWLRFEKRFNYTSGIRVELEAVGLVGEIGNVSDDSATPSERKIQQFGAALELEVQWEELWGFGLDAGFATGDDVRSSRPGEIVLTDANSQPNREITTFRFDRDYHVDLLLFREVMGTISNAVYIKPWASYDFFEGPESALGFRVDLMYAQAMNPVATPGGESFLGFEADLRFFYEELDKFNLDLEAGFLFPGGAFKHVDANNSANNRDPSFAFTLQARFSFQF